MTGQEIRTIRQQLRLSQHGFAEKLGVKRLTIARWESDKTKPNAKYLAMLEKLSPDTTDAKNVSGKQDFVSPPDTTDTNFVSGKQENVSGKQEKCITPDTNDTTQNDTKQKIL